MKSKTAQGTRRLLRPHARRPAEAQADRRNDPHRCLMGRAFPRLDRWKCRMVEQGQSLDFTSFQINPIEQGGQAICGLPCSPKTAAI
jgi:hypothetical protein